MGDRYYLTGKCAYCGEKEGEIYYAPTCEIYTFECAKCGKESFINSDLKIIKCEDVTYEDVEDSFLNATNVNWSKKDIKKMCKSSFRKIKNLNNKNEKRWWRFG